MEYVVPTVFILLGWMLGLLSPRLVELIQRSYRREDLKRSMFIELEDLRPKLAANVFQVAQRDGEVDSALLEWIEPIWRADKSNPQNRIVAEVSAGMRQQPDQLQMVSKILAAKETRRGLTFKKVTLPFLTSQLHALYLFSPEFQRVALKILARLDLLNQEMDVAWFNFQKTFDSALSETSNIAVTQNFNESCQHIGKMCRDLVDDCDILLSKDK